MKKKEKKNSNINKTTEKTLGALEYTDHISAKG